VSSDFLFTPPPVFLYLSPFPFFSQASPIFPFLGRERELNLSLFQELFTVVVEDQETLFPPELTPYEAAVLFFFP